MILAAGRGERMRPLTDTTPKPLLKVRDRPLLIWLLDALRAAQCPRWVVNSAWLGSQIEFAVQQYSEAFAIPYALSREAKDGGHALETAGGIARALPLLFPDAPHPDAPEACWLMAGDVFVPDFVFSTQATEAFLGSNMLAHLWLVPNPAHHPGGDFWIEPEASLQTLWNADVGLARHQTAPASSVTPTRYTYSTIALVRKTLFLSPWCAIPYGNPDGVAAPLAPLLRTAMDHGRVSAQIYHGAWTDVGTPTRLAQLNSEEPTHV
jgi:MurNAc alpha-1-phosphate uridylyltransferase